MVYRLAMYVILYTLSSKPADRQVVSSFFFLYRFFSQAVYGMHDAHGWPGQEHTWADITHDPADFFSHCRFVAMNFTVAAGGFPFLERAVLQSLLGIVQEFVTLGAKPPALFMFVATIPTDHELNGLSLPLHSRFFCHISSCEVSRETAQRQCPAQFFRKKQRAD